ncbi:MAG: hypothetical protein KAT32_04690 [Candidatus Moranbacteria bacterium]|nr:hypothetical protein [Candidatus Moranbacteria bacterium]
MGNIEVVTGAFYQEGNIAIISFENSEFLLKISLYTSMFLQLNQVLKLVYQEIREDNSFSPIIFVKVIECGKVPVLTPLNRAQLLLFRD